jgi:hypothetical protein
MLTFHEYSSQKINVNNAIFKSFHNNINNLLLINVAQTTRERNTFLSSHEIIHNKSFENERRKRENIVTSSYTRNVFFQLKKHISFSVVRARHDDKFVTRLTFVIRIVWFTEFDDKNIAFFSFSNSFSYMKKNSSKKIWTESEAIDRDVWRFRFADV